MCGIAGLVGEFIPELAVRMNEAQRHRGPDGRGVFEDPAAGVALAHVRLAILDLSPTGAQPMTTPSDRFVIVFNGEIYNFRELRRDLEALGESFASTSDTEVLLRGLERQGPDFVRKLNGMFAFALWDRRERELLLARDPQGVKPLYYCEPKAGVLAFASEIKALLCHPAVPRRPQPEALLQHLAFCHSCGDRTALEGIRRLPPGTLLRWRASGGTSELRRYWEPSFGERSPSSYGEAVRQLRDALKVAVDQQLIADVPVGVFLSGGVDSTLITALVPEQRRRTDIRAYTITYPSAENILDGAAEDTPFARRAAGSLQLSHVEREIKPDVTALWPKLIRHLEEPVADPAAIACYLVCELARANRTIVLLSGQGGDELFGGYPRYHAMALASKWDSWPRPVRKALAWAGGKLPGAKEGRLGPTLRRIRRGLTALDQEPDHRFLSYCAATPDSAILGVLSEDFRRQLNSRLPADACVEQMVRENLAGMDRWLERDLTVYLPNHNLLYTDKMAMSVGIEARVPLLDLAVVNMVTAFPWEWKVRDGLTKAILRDAARGIIPDEVIDRPKAGFGAPYRKWLRYDLAEMWDDLTTESVVQHRGWFDHRALLEIRERSQSGKQDLYMLQWAILTIELWARQFIDRNPAEGC
jgi:asparagine synthase (glutamine-hydrolysing)